MADSTGKLRRKIASATDLHAVVRAMKAQAAASVGQYAQSVDALGDYALTVEMGLGACFRQDRLTTGAPTPAPATDELPLRAVVFGSDQGLVGRFNDWVVELALQTLTPQRPGLQVWAVGERLRASLADAGITAQGSFAVPASVQAITGQVTDILLAVIDTPVQAPAADAAPALLLFYNRPSGGSTYTPVSQRLLPLDEAWRRDLAGRPWPTPLPAQRLGSAAETLRGLIGEYVFVSLFRASAASLASENASRLAAMDRADRNIDKMLGTLHSRFHRSRQRTIDEELSDVISGFKALKPQVEA